MSSRHQEFIDAHAGVLDTIAAETERYIADAPDAVVVRQDSFDDDPVILTELTQPTTLFEKVMTYPIS